MSRAFRVGSWTIEPERNRVSGAGGEVRLEPKVMEVLLCLAGQPGEVVSKEQLLAAVWAETFVTDDVLTRAISELRRAFGEDAQHPHVIETIPKRGYRLVAAVSQPEAIPAARPKRRPTLMVTGALAMLVIAAAALLLAWRPPPLSETDYIVVAEFENRTGDEVFDGTLRQGLMVKLEESPFLNVIGEQQIAETLRLMERPPHEPLTRETAREVCVRRGATAMLAGSIVSLGRSYAITLEASSCATGETLARAQAEAATKEAVLDALGKSSVRLRRKLGESLASMQKFDKPLGEATTSSLEALKALAMAKNAALRNQYGERKTFLRRALELDPNFATAYVDLSYALHDQGDWEEAVRNAERAFELRHRVSERERLMITENYYALVLHDIHKSTETSELWRGTYPRDRTVHSLLGVNYSLAGQQEKGLAAFAEALHLFPEWVGARNNLGYSYLTLSRFADAKDALEQALVYAENTNTRLLLWRTAFCLGDGASMTRHAEALRGRPEEFRLLALQSRGAMVRGQVREARRLRTLAIEMARATGYEEASADFLAAGALGEGWMGSPQEARRLAAAALEYGLRVRLHMTAALALAAVGDAPATERIARELIERFPSDTLLHHRDKPLLDAFAQLERSNPVGALELLRIAGLYDMTSGMYGTFLRGTAYMQAGSPGEAAAEFRRVLDNPGLTALFPTGPLSRLGLARAYTQMGDLAQSRKAYEDLFALWKDADPDLPLLLEARAEYAALELRAAN